MLNTDCIFEIFDRSVEVHKSQSIGIEQVIVKGINMSLFEFSLHKKGKRRKCRVSMTFHSSNESVIREKACKLPFTKRSFSTPKFFRENFPCYRKQAARNCLILMSKRIGSFSFSLLLPLLHSEVVGIISLGRSIEVMNTG